MEKFISANGLNLACRSAAKGPHCQAWPEPAQRLGPWCRPWRCFRPWHAMLVAPRSRERCGNPILRQGGTHQNRLAMAQELSKNRGSDYLCGKEAGWVSLGGEEAKKKKKQRDEGVCQRHRCREENRGGAGSSSRWWVKCRIRLAQSGTKDVVSSWSTRMWERTCMAARWGGGDRRWWGGL
jgi:hypothetical protein